MSKIMMNVYPTFFFDFLSEYDIGSLKYNARFAENEQHE